MLCWKKKIFIFNLMFPMRKTINGTTSVRLSWRQKRGMFAVLHCLCVFHSLLTNCCFDETLQRYNDRLSDWSSFFICLSFVLVYFLSASGTEKKWQSVKSSGCSLSLSRVVGTGSYSISMLTVCCILLKHMLWVWFCRDSEKRNRENKKN